MLSSGQILYNVHLYSQCKGHTCCIHNSSAHALWEAKQWWDNDTASMFRECPHGMLHPDPDDLAHKMRSLGLVALIVFGDHDCDGCCMTGPSEPQPPAPKEIGA